MGEALLQGGNSVQRWRMRDEPQLRVRVVNDEIVVTLPGCHYAVTYSPSLHTGAAHNNEEIRVPG